jgi:putative nucleotidyltransferase with HDIG domain
LHRFRLISATQLYVASVVAVAAAVGAALVLSGAQIGNVWTVIALAVVAAGAERGSVKFASSGTSTTEQSISLLPTLFAAVLFGPLAAAIVGAASMLGDPELVARDEGGRAPRLKWATYTSTRFIGGAVTGVVAAAAGGLVPSTFGAAVFATLVAALAGALVDVGFTVLTAAVRGRDVVAVARMIAPLLYVSAPVYAPIVALLVVAYESVSPWTAPLFFVPALAAQRLFALYQHERRLSEELTAANAQLERANLSFASGLVATLDARDQYTAGHSAAVAVYSRDIAERMGLDEATRQKIYVSGLVHDIGKIGLSAGLLEKPGALTLEERRQMQEHSAIGERILANVETYPDIAVIVRHHHERVDGNGYPDNLVGEEIPLLSRIIAVADAYNAMTSNRPYREAMPSRVARLRLAQAVESQFDTSVVAAFEAILAGADESYRMAKSAEFSFGSVDAESSDFEEMDQAKVA